MLDTNTPIYLIEHRPPEVAQRVNALAEDERLCMSFFTFAELLKGAAGSVRRDEVLRRLDALVSLVSQVPVVYGASRGLCEHYALQVTRLKSAGTPIGANELWIACHALAEEATLVTDNRREFARVAGLRLDNWVSAGAA